jgi:hypothetical protein
MASLQDDTRQVKEEFDAISTPTQVFIAALVGLGICLGVLLGLWFAVEKIEEGQGDAPAPVIEWDGNTYRLDEGGPEGDSPEGG